MAKKEFIERWRQTVHGSQEDIQKKVRWSTKHTSDSRKHFDQVAHYATGEPLILCRLCGNTLPHPNTKSDGTNTINRKPIQDNRVNPYRSDVSNSFIPNGTKYLIQLIVVLDMLLFIYDLSLGAVQPEAHIATVVERASGCG
jgi:hypothetical protein